MRSMAVEAIRKCMWRSWRAAAIHAACVAANVGFGWFAAVQGIWTLPIHAVLAFVFGCFFLVSLYEGFVFWRAQR